jgi:thiol-disulfide isomerase/thioredoxin/tetratricopeptide (TPR) repeat protein
MKKLVTIFVLTFFVFVSVSLAQKDQVATFKPKKPKIGDIVSITYNPSIKASKLNNAQEITAEVLILMESKTPVLEEVKMEKKNNIWKGSFKISDEKSRLILFKFASEDTLDDNDVNPWNIIVYGKDNKPLPEAHLSKYQLLYYGGNWGYEYKSDKDAAKSELSKEKELYPNSVNASSYIWSSTLKANPDDETKTKIGKEVLKIYSQCKNDESKVVSLLRWFEQTGQKDKSEQIIKEGIEKNPQGKIARYSKAIEMNKEKNPAKKAELYEKLINVFSSLTEDEKNSYLSTAIYYYTQGKEYDKAVAIIEKNPSKFGSSYNNLAWPLIEKGEQLEKAVEWAKKGVELQRSADASIKPTYLSLKDWKKSKDNGLAMVLDTYGLGLFKLGKTEESEKAYAEAYSINKGSNEEINERYVECLVKNGKNDKAVEVSSESMNNGKYTEKMIEQYKTAYVKVKGSDKGFDEMVSNIKNKAKNEMKAKLLKEMINKPAPQFDLKDLNGNSVKLTDLKGKVVVVDFWATWCGPCKASFPTLQKMYDKYKNDPNIAILALNTWENDKGEDRVKNVKKFIADNKYTFPVLFDEDFVSKYGVEGIPTKFILDREGNIQFKNVGFENEQKMIDEMELEFEFLLSNDFKSIKK